MDLLKRWKTVIPVLTLLGIMVGFLAQRAFAPQRDDLVIKPPPAAQIPALEHPAREHSLSGTVVSPDGSPVPDALLWLRAGDEPHWTYTDARGEYHLHALGKGPWNAKIVARGFDPLAIEIPESSTEHSIRLGPLLDPVPTLPALTRASLAGQVTSGLPLDLEGAEVVLTPALPPETLNAPLPRRAPVAADGRFEIADLIIGEYQVEVVPAWARGGSWPDLARALDATEPLGLSHAPEGAKRELAIALATGAAHGKLVDLQGSPIEGAMILASSAADPSRVWPPGSSRTDGSFSVEGLPSGRYLISIRAGSAAVQQAIEIRPGELLDLGLAPLEVRPSR